jgi:hypothetical protein
VSHRHARGARGQLRLGECIDLRAAKAVAAPWIGVGRDVEPVCVRADVRVVAEIGTRIRATGVRPITRDIDVVDVPATSWVRRLADGDVELVLRSRRTS